MQVESVSKNMDRIVRLFKVLSSENRLAILTTLHHGEKSVGELERAVPLSQSALSQHLAKLRHEKVVQTRREAQTIYYSLKDKKVQDILNSICEILENEDPL